MKDILITPLEEFESASGTILRGLRANERTFDKFGEVYFSSVAYRRPGDWKCHAQMTMNLIVPVGLIEFVFAKDAKGKEFQKERIGSGRFARLTVPPGWWFNFIGLSPNVNLLVNVANSIHDPIEIQRKPKEEIFFDWKSIV